MTHDFSPFTLKIFFTARRRARSGADNNYAPMARAGFKLNINAACKIRIRGGVKAA
jgi:hypothetical protein